MKNKFKFLIISTLLILGCALLGTTKFCFNPKTPISLILLPEISTNSGFDYVCDTDPEIMIDASDIKVATSLTSNYDLRNALNNIQVENQQNYGICYAFASLTILENYVAMNFEQNYQFSPIHLATSQYAEKNQPADFENGGTVYTFYSYFTKGVGPVLESEMPFSTYYTSSDPSSKEAEASNFYKSNKNNFTRPVTVDSILSFPNVDGLTGEQITTNRDRIKTAIQEKGGCISNIYAGEFDTSEDKTYLRKHSASQPVNHMITIIGWNDNYQVPGYETAGAGAYLCLNSWGSSWGNNGTFYVSYYDPNIEDTVYAINEASLANPKESYFTNLEDSDTDVGLSHYGGSSYDRIVVQVVDLNTIKPTHLINKIGVALFGTSDIDFAISFLDNLPTTSTKNLYNSTTNKYEDIEFLNVNVPTSWYSTTTNISSQSNGGSFYGPCMVYYSLTTPIEITKRYAVIYTKIQGLFAMYGNSYNETTTNVLNRSYTSNFTVTDNGFQQLSADDYKTIVRLGIQPINFPTPTITSQPTGINETYNGSTKQLKISASYSMSYPLQYQWEYSEDNTNFNPIAGATTDSFNVKNVSDSGYYRCKVSVNEETYIDSNVAQVTITKANYNISWDTTDSLSYKAQTQSPNINGLNQYSGLSATITIQKKADDVWQNTTNPTDVGEYRSIINISNQDTDNYNNFSLEDKYWEIIPREVSIKINDVNLTDINEFNSYTNFSYTITSNNFCDNYLPSFNYATEETTDPFSKTITATYTGSNNYNVSIIPGKINVALNTISTECNYATITLSNKSGTVYTSQLLANSVDEGDLDTDILNFLDENNLIVYDIYSLSLQTGNISDEHQIAITLNPNLVGKNVKVYQITEDGLALLNSTLIDNNLIITASSLGKFIIVEAPVNTKIKDLIIVGAIIAGCILICIVAIVLIRHKRNLKYKSLSTTYIPH